MLTYDAALDVIASQCAPLGASETALQACCGRVLAESLCAPHDLPPVANAAMDGYAVRAEDLRHASHGAPVELKLIDTIAAGHRSSSAVETGTCAAIMTGAELPRGADAVVKIEETQRTGALVAFCAPTQRGAFIRPRAAEARAGDVLVAQGHVVTPAVIGVAASCGRASLLVQRRPRVGCVITGDEIAPPGTIPTQEQKYDAVGPALCAALQADRCDVIRCRYVADNPEDLRACMQENLGDTDLLLIAGGASMGVCDYVQDVLRGLHVKESFWKVAIKPGKPLWFGVHDATRVFNLPGNPVSALVTYYLFVRFAVRLLQGCDKSAAQLIECDAVLDEPLKNDEERMEFVRGMLRYENGAAHVQPRHARCSSMLSSMANANALIKCPPKSGFAASASVRVLMLPPV